MTDLAGRVALVTGASAGIGAATARAFAAAGMRVALCARRRDRLEALAAELRARTDASVHAVDVTDEKAVRAMVDEVAGRFGALDVLVNNAGRGLAARFEDTRPDELRALLELNLIAVLTATQAALPIMRRQGRGHVINVSSIVGRRNLPGRTAYGATKFGLGGLTEALRLELRGTGIAVSLVYPIFTLTEFHEVETRREPLKRTGPAQSAETVARAILRCVRRPRPEVYPYAPARLLAGLAAVAPGLVDRLMDRALRRAR
ncbi:MAG TPA: SDR family NAD(P)-dependent oxidoreductase [Methylomirabilota bacterium]|nr:SDR family NAD(P)-dependent oxidoreductase [Methylomirabilota bacterium]